MNQNPVSMRRSHSSRRYTAVVAAGLAILGAGSASYAQTSGQQVPVPGDVVLNDLGFTLGVIQPSTLDTANPTSITYTGTRYNYIKNPYMAVVVGVQGTRSVSYSTENNGLSLTASHNIPGWISFGNLGGSLRITNDDFRPLNGFSLYELFTASPIVTSPRFTGGGIPGGYGVWPLPGHWDSGEDYDYSAYVSARVDPSLTDPTQGLVRVVGSNNDNSTFVVPPVYRSNPGDNYLFSEATLNSTGTLRLRQEIRLFRNTAQLRWVIVNSDTVAHTVDLKFGINERGAIQNKIDGTGFGQLIQPSYFYSDPQAGPTQRAQIYNGGTNRAIPNRLEVLGARYQADTSFVEPFHSRHIFNEFGATQPSLVYFGDSENLDPIADAAGAGSFLPPDGTNNILPYNLLEDGVGVGVYWLNRTVAPGQTSAPIITYYGNGNSTDRIDPDFTTATEAEEAFQYNAETVNTLTAQQKAAPSFDLARLFLSPQQFTIYGSVYNRQLSESQFAITLPDVRMSVTLPSALRFGTSPTTGVRDVAEKAIGSIAGDQDGQATWVAEPTGDQFGTFSYQLTANVGGISPLSRTVSRSVTIPATPLYNVTADSFQMIGFPFDFDRTLTNNNDASSIINGLSQPTDTNPGSTTFYRWIPDSDSIEGAGRYEATSTLERGIGYFYKPAISRLLFLNGARPDTNATPLEPGAQTQYYQFVLERGWNMISNPFIYAIPANFVSFADIDNANPDADLNYTTISDAVTAGLVRGGIFFYNTATQNYDFFQDFTQELRPYQAYWVYLEERKVLRIATPTQKQSGVLPATSSDDTNPPTRGRKVVVGAIASGRAFPATQTNDNWKLQLTAKRMGKNTSDSASDSATLIGVSTGAKDGDDSRDLPKPPPIIEDYVSVRVMHEVKPGKSRAFAQDLKAPGGGKKSWDLEVVSDKEGPVSLSWPNLSRLPRTVRLTLTDKQTGRKVALSGASSTVVNVAANTPSRFVLTADKQASRPLALTNIIVKREGGTRGVNGRGAGNYSISFKSTADASIEARIMTLSGKQLNTLETGRSVSGDGITKLSWNGRAQNGDTLPAGNYVVELSARTDSGETVTVKRPMLLLQ